MTPPHPPVNKHLDHVSGLPTAWTARAAGRRDLLTRRKRPPGATGDLQAPQPRTTPGTPCVLQRHRKATCTVREGPLTPGPIAIVSAYPTNGTRHPAPDRQSWQPPNDARGATNNTSARARFGSRAATHAYDHAKTCDDPPKSLFTVLRDRSEHFTNRRLQPHG